HETAGNAEERRDRRRREDEQSTNDDQDPEQSDEEGQNGNTERTRGRSGGRDRHNTLKRGTPSGTINSHRRDASGDWGPPTRRGRPEPVPSVRRGRTSPDIRPPRG